MHRQRRQMEYIILLFIFSVCYNKHCGRIDRGCVINWYVTAGVVLSTLYAAMQEMSMAM